MRRLSVVIVFQFTKLVCVVKKWTGMNTCQLIWDYTIQLTWTRDFATTNAPAAIWLATSFFCMGLIQYHHSSAPVRCASESRSRMAASRLITRHLCVCHQNTLMARGNALIYTSAGQAAIMKLGWEGGRCKTWEGPKVCVAIVRRSNFGTPHERFLLTKTLNYHVRLGASWHTLHFHIKVVCVFK